MWKAGGHNIRVFCVQDVSPNTARADYFAECAADPFRNGAGPYAPPHENWRPDFEFLTRPAEMLKVFDRASSAEAM